MCYSSGVSIVDFEQVMLAGIVMKVLLFLI